MHLRVVVIVLFMVLVACKSEKEIQENKPVTTKIRKSEIFKTNKKKCPNVQRFLQNDLFKCRLYIICEYW